MYGQLYYFPSQCIPYAHSQHSGLTAKVRELPNRLHRLCFPYRICRYNGQHVVGPFYDRVGKPPHHLHGVGRPTQLWQDTAASPSHCPSLETGRILHWTNPTTVSMQKKSDSIANGNGLLPNSASSNPCRKRWRCRSASAMWWSTLP